MESEGKGIGDVGGGFEVVKELEGILVIWQLAGDSEDGVWGEGGEKSAEVRVDGPGNGIGGLQQGKCLGDGAGQVPWRRRRWCEMGIGGEVTESGGGGGGVWGSERFWGKSHAWFSRNELGGLKRD